MPYQQKIFALLASFLLFIAIIYLVKKGKLREEYSWLWLLTGFVISTLVLWYDLLLLVTKLIGAVLPTTTLFIFGIIFLISITLHFTVKISALTNQVKNLSQKLSLLEAQNNMFEKI
jgi:hypothetical protein